jgi:hypothetical protein
LTQDPLRDFRISVAAAETSLERARDNMRAAAEKRGLSTKAIFGESRFVARSTAERWVADAKADARAKARERMNETIEAMNAARLAASAPSEPQRDDPKVFAAKIIAAGKKARGEI